jgi:hypothetical protein
MPYDTRRCNPAQYWIAHVPTPRDLQQRNFAPRVERRQELSRMKAQFNSSVDAPGSAGPFGWRVSRQIELAPLSALSMNVQCTAARLTGQ